MSDEPRIPGLRRLVRLPNRPVEADVDEELAFHVESRTRDLVARGIDEAEARRVALGEFGDVVAARRELTAVDRRRRRKQRLSLLLEASVLDLRHAVRSLRRSKAFAATAVATLAIGIGAAVAMFAVVDGVLLRQLPYKDPSRLVGVYLDMPPISMYHTQQSAATYFTFRTRARSIDDIGIYNVSAANVSDVASAMVPRRVLIARATASLFSTLGVGAQRGRVFDDAEDRPHAAPVMMISDAMWRAQFGRDPSVVGRRIDVDGVRREIVGVMPPSFRYPSPETEIWIPLALDPANPPPTAFSYWSVARLAHGATPAGVKRELALLLPLVPELYPNFVPGISTKEIMAQAKPVPLVVPLGDDMTGAIAPALWTIAAAAALLLLVAWVNAANLTLVRFDARQRELGVRQALGADHGRVGRYLTSESAVLAGAAGALALPLAWGLVHALVSLGPAGVPRLSELRIDAASVLVCAVLAAGAALAITAFPLLRIRAGALTLRDASRGNSAGHPHQRMRSLLVGAQIAIAVVVVSASALLLRSFQRLHAVKPGFDPSHVSTLWVALPKTRYASDDDIVRFYASLVDRVAALPDVESVGVTSRLPFVIRGMNPNPMYPENEPEWATHLPPLQSLTTVGGDYFRAMRIPLLAGRLFERMDSQRDGEAVVSSRTAQIFWHDSTGAAALGKRFRALPTGPWYTVVGVVGNTRDTTLSAGPTGAVYFPEVGQKDAVAVQPARSMALVIRTRGNGTAIVPAAERAVRDLDPSLPTFDEQRMTDRLRAATARLAFVILVLGAAAAITLALGAVGLYGVLAYLVTLRRRELGIRIALGASPAAIAAATTRQGVGLAAAGVLVGLIAFAAAARLLRGLLFNVAPWDPVAVGGSVLVLLALALAASWMPARRAARVDPAEALRRE